MGSWARVSAFLVWPLRPAEEGRVFNTPTGIVKPSDWPVVAKAGELILHRLRKDRVVDERVLRELRCELGVEIRSIERTNLLTPTPTVNYPNDDSHTL